MSNQIMSKFTANSDNIKADYSNFPKIGEICRFSAENNRLQAGDFGHIFAPVMAKSITSRGKLNNLSKANSTPNRAFFVRNFRTPKGNHFPNFVEIEFLSMVERKGKGLPFAVFLLKRFSTPLRSTAHRGKSDGRFSQNLLSKAFTMLYKFLTQLNDRQLTITITANSYAEALSRIQWHNRPICITRNLKTKGGVYA